MKEMSNFSGYSCMQRDTGSGKPAGFPLPSRRPAWLTGNPPAFTLIELLTVVSIIGVLAAIAIIAYAQYVDKAKVVTAMNEINMLEKEIYAYSINHPNLPNTLNDVGYGGFPDPWNRPYVYQPDLTIAPRTKTGVPINTDYDLYSEGRDGQTVLEITAAVSGDDIIRAGDGSYKGYANRY